MSLKPLEVSFFCVQPVAYDLKSVEKIYTAATPLSQELRESLAYKPLWLEYFKKYYNSFDHILPIDGIIDTLPRLKQELTEKSHALAPFLNSDKNKSYLLLDSRFNYFIIMYEIVMDISFEQLEMLRENGYDLYNEVRNLLVKSDEYPTISSCVQEGQIDTLKYIQNYTSKMIDKTLSENQVFIQNDTGNITCILQASLSEPEHTHLVEMFHYFNEKGERVGTPEFFKINSNDFSFNGRFHTFISNLLREDQRNEMYKIIPITFHMQYMWFYLKELNMLLNNFVNDFHVNNPSFMELTKTVNRLIIKVEFIILHNEHFKAAIEEYNEKVYKKIQSKWNIEDSLKNSNRYISFFKNHLDRLYDQNSLEAEQRQNKILLVIGVLQLFTIISVWNDYLSSIQIVKSRTENFGISKFLPFGLESFTEIMLPISLISMIFLLYLWYVKSK